MQNITKGAIATAVKNTEPNEQTGYILNTIIEKSVPMKSSFISER